ncbi:MAG: SMC-Scp complex subunit ScpB [Coriobacteriales bacterium]
MTRNETDAYLMGALEALLFVSDEPVSAARLAALLEEQPSRVDQLLQALQQEYEEANRGMQLREVAGGWRFYSHPAYHELIEGYIVSWDTRRMSQAALEALAVIAYHQPVTRAAVNAIRGVNSEAVISSLVEKGLVKEVGREKAAGAAILYGTTRTFLEKFGLKSVRDLPPLEDYAPDEATRLYIRERLSGASQEPDEVSDEDEQAALSVLLSSAEAAPQEVDRGEGEREDDPQAMAAILGEALTEKAVFGETGA